MVMRGYFIDSEGKCFREFDERLAELEKSKKNADDDKKWLSEETIRRREELDDKYWKKTDSLGNVNSYMAYMKTFPEGRHVKECVQRVLALRKLSEDK